MNSPDRSHSARTRQEGAVPQIRRGPRNRRGASLRRTVASALSLTVLVPGALALGSPSAAAEASRTEFDSYEQGGRQTATLRSSSIAENDGVMSSRFVRKRTHPPAPGTASPADTPKSGTTAAPLPTAGSPLIVGGFPTPETTGSRVPLSSLTPVSGGLKSSYAGQVIERKDITGNVRILHDNVTVRDSRVSFTSTYGLYVAKKADGSCPSGTRFEYVEVDGRLADEKHVPVYSPGCPWVLDHAHVHGVGRAVKVTNDNTVSNSYIVSSRTGDSGSHRGAVGNNGGRNNILVNNVLMCEGTGCSAAVPMYGDFAPVNGMLLQRNLLATTGSYCAYGGSLSGKRYPQGSNIKFIDNHFSTRFSAKCGRYGHISGFAGAVRGNEWRGNVWHETGAPA